MFFNEKNQTVQPSMVMPNPPAETPRRRCVGQSQRRGQEIGGGNAESYGL